MLSPRWMKLLRDAQATQGRMLMMLLATGLGIFAVATILSAYTILTREMSANYLATNPASAALQLDRVDDALLAQVRQRPEIAAAEARASVLARVKVGPDKWLPLRLFVVPDFRAANIAKLSQEAGVWPPPDGSVLLEREALPLAGVKLGGSMPVKMADGASRQLPVSGTVHDPGLAPAWQEQTVYAYATPATLRSLGESGDLNILNITVKDNALDVHAIEQKVGALALALKAQGHTVNAIRIPPPGRHPHQSQMTSVLKLFLIFSGLALLLGAILSATLIGGLLAAQVRQIGIMKTLGARSAQIAGVYAALVLLIGVLASCLALPIGILAGQGFAGLVARLLNLKLSSVGVPVWAYASLLSMGILLPLCLASFPIWRAMRTTVRDAIDDCGVTRQSFGGRGLDYWLSQVRGLDATWMLALRNTFRRRGRLLLTLALLAVAGALFIGSLNVKLAWERNLAESAAERRYDIEVELSSAQPEAQIVALIGRVPGVQKVESWNAQAAARARDDGLAIEVTYPDGGHGKLQLRAVPAGSNMLQLGMESGRWLAQDDSDGVVLNYGSKAFFPDAQVGDTIRLTVAGKVVTRRLRGVAHQILSMPSIFINPQGYAELTGQHGQSDTFRVLTRDHETQAVQRVARDIEHALERENIGVERTLTEAILDAALGGHIYIFIFSLMAMSLLMAGVGALGLMSAMASNVVERTREFGIMRVIGGSQRTLLGIVMGEGVCVGLLSCVPAILLALPLSWALGIFLGKMSFGTPLDLAVSYGALLFWLALILIVSVVASAYPASKAARMTIRATLVYL